MLTTKDHPLVINRDRNLIKIWDDEKNQYEEHTFEFIQDLYELAMQKEKAYGVIYE